MNLNPYMDLTLLKADGTQEQIKEICRQAKEYKMTSVCVNPYYVSLVKEELQGTDVKVCVVVGFPLGANITKVKVFETAEAIKSGAQEVDMVINVGALKDKKYDYVEEEIRQVKKTCNDHGAQLLKVIIETCYLTDEEKRKVCQLALTAGADYVKTSTGFGTEGATIENVRLMKNAVGEKAMVKASGGIREREKAEAMIHAGASRIGTSTVIQ